MCSNWCPEPPRRSAPGKQRGRGGTRNENVFCPFDLDCDEQINPTDAGIAQSLFGTCAAPRESCP